MSEVIGYNVNGKIVDTQSYTGGGSEIKFDNSKEALEIVRHSCAHLMAAAIKELAIKQGMHTLKDEGIYKVMHGKTSIEEILRVIV